MWGVDESRKNNNVDGAIMMQ